MNLRITLAIGGGLVLGAAVIVACSGPSSSHPTTASQCAPGVPCIGVGSPGGPAFTGDAGSDGADSGDAASDTATADVGDTGLAMNVPNGEVHSATIVTADPATAPLDTADGNLYIFTTRGGTISSNAVTSGKFAVTGADIKAGFCLLRLVLHDPATGNIDRTLYEAPFDGTTTTITSPLAVPLFATDAQQAWATSLGLTLSTSNKAAIVYELVDSTGAPVAGITATPSGGSTASACDPTSTVGPCGPYYDNGDVLTATATATGPKGTIVFLGLPVPDPTGFYPYNVDLSGAATKTISNVSFKADAITFVRMQVK